MTAKNGPPCSLCVGERETWMYSASGGYVAPCPKCTGDKGRVSAWAALGGEPEHRDFVAGKVDALRPGYQIGRDVIISEFVRVHRGITRPTVVGDRTMLQAGVHVAHDVVVGADCEIGAGVILCGHVIVGHGVKIGGNSWVKPFVTIGDGARIGGGSVVIRDVPAGEVWAGNPAKPLTSGREAEARGQVREPLSEDEYAARCWAAVRESP